MSDYKENQNKSVENRFEHQQERSLHETQDYYDPEVEDLYRSLNEPEDSYDPEQEQYLREIHIPTPEARIADYYSSDELQNLYDQTYDRASQRDFEVNEHKTSMKLRFLDELHENPPHIPNPEHVQPRAFAAALVEKAVTPYEQELYDDIKAQLNSLPLEHRLKDYEPYQPGQQEPIDETPLEIATYHANGVCTPTERREAALDALQEHKKERDQVHPKIAQETKLPDGTTFTHYDVSRADLARSDYPGPTPADDRIYALLNKSQAPRPGSEVGNRYSHIVDEFSERQGLLRKKCIPKDFIEKLQQREKESLDKFIAKNYGAPVNPPAGSKGKGQYVASVTTHATTHHIIQDKASGRVVVVDGKNQPNLNKIEPGAQVELSAKQGPNNRVSLTIHSQQRKLSNGLER